MADELGDIIAALYASEINASISWFWDGGLELQLGDTMNGIVADTRILPSPTIIPEAVAWLKAAALRHFPKSEFADLNG